VEPYGVLVWIAKLVFHKKAQLLCHVLTACQEGISCHVFFPSDSKTRHMKLLEAIYFSRNQQLLRKSSGTPAKFEVLRALVTRIKVFGEMMSCLS